MKMVLRSGVVVRGRQIIAVTAIIATGSTGMQPVLAVAPGFHVHAESPRQRTAAILNYNNGASVSDQTLLDAQRQGQTTPQPSGPALPTQLDLLQLDTKMVQMRDLAARLKASSSPRAVNRAERISRWLDIAAAKTPAERHEKIQRLPVTITVARDGQAMVKSFVAGGKTRVRVSVPVEPIGSSFHRAEMEVPSGPAIGAFTCYDGEPEPCATQQEMDDLFALIAAAQADLEVQETEYEDALLLLYDRLDAAPEGDFEVDESEADADFPVDAAVITCAVASDDCAGEAASAAGNMAVAAGTYVGAYAAASGAAASGVFLSAAACAGWSLLIIGSATLAAVAVAEFVDCVQNTEPASAPELGFAFRQEVMYSLNGV